MTTVAFGTLRFVRTLREAGLRLEARIAATKSEIIEWMIGSIGFRAVGIVGAIVTPSRVTH